MNPKKQKEKDRRRARKLAEEAWDAVNTDNLDLAEKIIRRAVIAQQDNPVLWNDQGVILGLRQKEAEAADAFRAAISLAPTFVESYVRLAALRFRQGFTAEAVALQSQAVRYAPENTGYAEQLSAYQALAESKKPKAASPPTPTAYTHDAGATPPADSLGYWPERLGVFDWESLAGRLTRDGCVVLGRLLDPATCEDLCNMFDRDELFAKTVVMERPEFGQGVYRYFRSPVPAVDQLRRAIYPYAARVANCWERLLREPERFPPEWDAFREVCRGAGQTTPTPILLKYGPGGFNALHRDLRGAVYFPVQMAVVLSQQADPGNPQSDGFRGGEFLLYDVPERKKSRRRLVPAGQGDAVLFCTRDRLVRVGDVYGLQPVKHGAARITAGTRFVLGVPFHEYR